MKIALINQPTGKGSLESISVYQKKIKGVLNDTSADVIAAPEFAVSGRIPMSSEDFYRFCDGVKPLSRGKLFFPGTALVSDGRYLTNTAPVFVDGKLKLVNKKSSHDELEISKKHNLEYKTGDDGEGIFNYGGKTFAVEICRDHGMGKLKRASNQEVDFHFVLANNLGGISPEKMCIKEGGVGALVDTSGSFCYKKYLNQFKPLNALKTSEYSLMEI